MTLHHDMRTQEQEVYLSKKLYFRLFYFFSGVQHSESPSRRKINPNGRRHCVWLADKRSWIRTECPKVPRMRRIEQKQFH